MSAPFLANVTVAQSLIDDFHVFTAPAFFATQGLGHLFLAQLVPPTGVTLKEALIYGGTAPIKINDSITTLELRDMRGNYVRSDQLLRTLEAWSRRLCFGGQQIPLGHAVFKNFIAANPFRVVLCDCDLARPQCVGNLLPVTPAPQTPESA